MPSYVLNEILRDLTRKQEWTTDNSLAGLVLVNPNDWLVGRGERIRADVHFTFLRV